MPLICRSFQDLLVVQISHKLTKYSALNCFFDCVVYDDYDNNCVEQRIGREMMIAVTSQH